MAGTAHVAEWRRWWWWSENGRLPGRGGVADEPTATQPTTPLRRPSAVPLFPPSPTCRTLTGLGAGNPLPLLATVLTYHVLPERRNATDLVAAGPLTTLEGGTLAVTADVHVVDRAPGVPNARIVQADVALANGVMHPVDHVLLPLPLGAARRLPPPCAVALAQLAGATPELSTLRRALAATGLT